MLISRILKRFSQEWYKERHYQSSRDGHSLPDLSSPPTHAPQTLPFPDLPSPSTLTPQALPFPEFGADLVTCELTHSCSPFKHLLSEILTSLGQQMLERWEKIG